MFSVANIIGFGLMTIYKILKTLVRVIQVNLVRLNFVSFRIKRVDHVHLVVSMASQYHFGLKGTIRLFNEIPRT